jgi:AraC-like DNA-binding protein
MTMRYREFEPSPALRPFVVCYWILEGRGDPSDAPQPVFPDGHPELVLHYGDGFSHLDARARTRQPRAALVGQTESALYLLHGRSVGVLGVRLKPSGLALLTKAPANEFSAQVVALRSAIGPVGDALLNAVGEANGDAARIGHLERFLKTRARKVDRRDGPIEAAVNLIRRRGGIVPIDALAQYTSMSTRQLHRTFVSRVGLSPKQYARVVRLQSALGMLEQGSSITNVAMACGYYDHPHFAHEFRRFSGLTPTEFVQDSSLFTRYFLDDAADLYKPEDSARG